MTVVIHRQQRQLLIAQRSVNLLNIVQYMALRNEQIFPTIIIDIFQSRAPAGTARRQRANASLQARTVESAAALVVVKPIDLARWYGDKKSGRPSLS